MSKKPWSKREIQFVIDNVNTMSLDDIAVKLDRSYNSVYLLAYRKGIPLHKQVEVNIMKLVVEAKFIKSDYFSPNREFYMAVGISQKRWSLLIRGYEQAKQQELQRVARHFMLSDSELEKIVPCCQLSLFK